jgi:hypothetical protein
LTPSFTAPADSDENGAFLIVIVSDLAKFFLQKALQQQQQQQERDGAVDDDDDREDVVFSSGEVALLDAGGADFDQVLSELIAELESLKDALDRPDIADIKAKADDVIGMSDDILTWDRFYETLFRPKTFRINYHPQIWDKVPSQNHINII